MTKILLDLNCLTPLATIMHIQQHARPARIFLQNTKKAGRQFLSVIMAGLLALTFAPFAFAQMMPLPSFPHLRYPDMASDPAITYGTLPNGVRFAVMSSHRPEGEVAIRVRFAAGSMVENDDQSGLMHFIEHMAFNGSENVPENEFDRLLAREGLAFGADTNAATNFTETSYRLDMPHADKLGLGLMLMSETARHLSLSTEAIDRERGIIAAEERARMSPAYRQFLAFGNQIAPNMRFMRRLPIGNMEVVRTAGRERFLELYQHYYTPQRTFVVVVGDVTKEKAIEEITKAFGDWHVDANADRPDPSMGEFTPIDGHVLAYQEPQLPTSVTLSVARPFVNLPDNLTTYELFAARALANNIVNTRLARLARQETAPFLGGQIGNGNIANSVEYFSLEAAPKDNSRWQETLNVTSLELIKAIRYGFGDEEVRVALADMRTGYQRGVQQADARRSADLAGEILAGFAGDGVVRSPAQDLATFETVAPHLTAQRLQAALVEMWGGHLPALMVSTTTPLAANEEATNQLLQTALRTAFSQSAPPPEVLATRNWSITNFGNSNPSYHRHNIADLGISEFTFANNVRLVFKQTDFEPGRVRVAVNFGNGTADMVDAPKGTDMALGAGFVAGGVGPYDIDALGRTLAGRTVGLNFGIEDNRFSFSSATTPDDLLLQLQVMAAYMTQPAWHDDGFNQLKSARDIIFRGLRSTPGATWGNFGLPILRSNNPRYNRITEAEFDALNWANARHWLEPALNHGQIEITIIGDVSAAQAVRTVQQTFARLPQRAAAPAPLPAAMQLVFTPGRGEEILRHQGRADQSLAMIYWPMRDYGDGAEVRALRVLVGVMQTRLNEVLREEEGGTYSPDVMWDPSTIYQGYGILGATIEVTPENSQRLMARIEAIAQDIANGNISEDLFNRAKTPLVADFEETRRNNPWWFNWMEGASTNPERYTIIRGARSQYEQVTREQVIALARQYLDPSKARIVRVLPEEGPPVGTPSVETPAP